MEYGHEIRTIVNILTGSNSLLRTGRRLLHKNVSGPRIVALGKSSRGTCHRRQNLRH